MNVRVITDFQKVDLRDQWNSLVAKCNDNFFLTYEVVAAWWKYFSKKRRQLRILAFEKENKVVAIAPFFSEKKLLASIMPVKCWYWLGVERITPDHMDMIYPPEHAAKLTDAFIRFLETHQHDWDAIHLQFMWDDSLIIKELNKRKGVLKILCSKYQREELCPYIALPDSYDKFLKQLKKKFRYELRRGYKEWQQAGYELKTVETRSELHKSLISFIRLHEMRWQEVGKKGNFVNANVIGFHREIIQKSNENWTPIFFEIVGSEGTVASLYAFKTNSKLYFYQLGYDPRFRNNLFVPGKILVDYAIHYAISHGLKEFDFLRGDEPYKFEWKPWVSIRYEPSYILFHNSITSRIYATGKLLQYEAARKLKHSNDFRNRHFTQIGSKIGH